MRAASLATLLALVATACSSFSEAGGDPPNAADGGSGSDASTSNGQADAATDPPDASAPPGPVAWWKLDEMSATTAADSAGTNHGTFIAPGAPAPGHTGNALATNGTGRVEVPYHPALQLGPAFTIALWANLATSENDSWMYAHGASMYFKLNARRPQIATGDGYASTVYELPVGQWHHLAATFSGGVAKFYVDGLRVPNESDTFTPETLPAPSAEAIKIGCANDRTDCANGLIDDVRLWRRALDDAEIAAIAK